MATIKYKGFDTTVQTIADRNAIPRKIDHMTVLVKDAIADPDVGKGKATYRWDATDLVWVLVSKTTHFSMGFSTEELIITEGFVTPANVPTDLNIWNIHIIDGDMIIADMRQSNLTITATSIGGLDEYNGKAIRFTYAHGTITQQMSSAIDEFGLTQQKALSSFTAEVETKTAEVEAKLTTVLEAQVTLTKTVTELQDLVYSSI